MKRKKDLRDEKTEKYFSDRISLDDDQWLLFDRVCNYDNCIEDAVTIKLYDRPIENITLLGTWFDGRWVFPNESNELLLWKLVKQHPKSSKKILRNLRTNLGEFKDFNLEWRCLRRKFRLQSIKLKRKLHI